MCETALSFVLPTCEEETSIDNALDKRARLSIIVPAYNEAFLLNQNVALIEKVVSLITDSYEIIIAEDGCSDETEKMVANIANNCSKVVHIHSDHRLGKGLALKKALKASKGQTVVFMDADLSTNLDHLPDVVKSVENGYDVAIGSRYVKGSYVKRPLSRAIASRVYNLLVKFLFWDNVSDHQCGFKGFNDKVLKDVIDEVTENGFLFDTELLVRAKSKGLRIIEIPVKWEEPKDRISKVNLFTDGIKMGTKIIELRFKLWAQMNKKRGEMSAYSRRLFLFTHRPNGVDQQKFYNTLGKHFSIRSLLPEYSNSQNSVYLINLGKNLSSFLKLFKLAFASASKVGQGIKIVDVITSSFFLSPFEKDVILLFGTPMQPEMQWLRYPKFAIKYAKFAQDLLIKKAKLVIAYNEMMGEYCEAVGAHTVIICPNYPTKDFKPTISKQAWKTSNKISKNTKIALFVGGGRMLEVYGLELLLKAWSLVEKEQRDVCLVIIGPVPTFWTKQTVEKLGIKHLFTIGPVPYSSLPNWINAADVCLAPRTPGFPVEFYNDKDSTKINEYAALSKPIVACGYSPSSRYLLVPQNPYSFAEGILKAFDDEVKPAAPHYWEENESLTIEAITKAFSQR